VSDQTDNVVQFPKSFVGQVSRPMILQQAEEHCGKEHMVIVGYDKDGDLSVWATSKRTAEVVMMLAEAQHFMLTDVDTIPDGMYDNPPPDDFA
jgi:hypothetical protein